MAGAFESTGIMPGSSSTGTMFSNPEFVQRLLRSLTGQQAQFGNLLSNPTASPLFQNQLQGLLQALEPSESAARGNLTDIFRGAGNTASSTFGGAARRLEGDILGKRQQVASNLLGQSFQQLTQALLGQMGLTPQLLNALKLSQGSRTGAGGSTSSGWSSIPPSQGLGTEMQSGNLPSTGPSLYSSPGRPSGSGMMYTSPGGPATSWAAQDDAYVQQQNALNQSIIDAYNNQYGNLGSTAFIPGGQYASGGSWQPPEEIPYYGGEGEEY